MSSDRTILHIVPSEPWGGIQALVPMLAREQIRQGKSVQVICLGRGTRIRDVAAGYGLGNVTRSVVGVLAPLRLLGLLLTERKAVLHGHCEPIWASALIAVFAKKRWIDHGHVYPDDELTWKKRVSLWLQRHFAARHIAISHSIGRALLASGVAVPATLDVVQNGVEIGDTPPVLRSGGETFTVGFVGRVVEEKGIFEFVQLAASLAGDADLAFAVYGDGADLTAARTLAEARSIGDRIVFHGYVEDIASAWANIDAAAIFSHREPFGLVFLEAALRGAPTISYENDSGGSEIAATLASAHRVAPGDVAAAATIVRALVADPFASRAALERDRTTIAEHFDIAVMARGIAAAYDRLDSDMRAIPQMPEVPAR